MGTPLENIETSNQIVFLARLPMMLLTRGIRVGHYRKTTVTVQDDVYQSMAGSTSANWAHLGDEVILLSTSQWRAISATEGGWIDDIGYSYCSFDLRTGDRLKFIGTGLDITLVVISCEAVGMTTQIAKRFKMANIGD